jgi:hypothetical protein
MVNPKVGCADLLAASGVRGRESGVRSQGTGVREVEMRVVLTRKMVVGHTMRYPGEVVEATDETTDKRIAEPASPIATPEPASPIATPESVADEDAIASATSSTTSRRRKQT